MAPKKPTAKPSTWIITEGIAGTENQCIGVTEALGVEPEIKRIKLRQPWRALSPYLGFERPCTFIPRLEENEWPDLLITSGRRAIAASRYIKKASKGRTFTLHIQDPRINPRHFDLLAVPRHDPARGANVIVTAAAPNRITEKRLAQAYKEFSTFKSLPAPRVAVLIGGTSNAYTLTPAIMETLATQLKALSEQGISLLITTSRRTGEENETILKKALKGTNAYIWNGQGANPYFGMLAWADTILVTADSASMLSEACTTGKPVYMINMETNKKGKTGRIAKLHENLISHGGVRPFEGRLESWNYIPLRDSDMIAAAVRERLKKKDNT